MRVISTKTIKVTSRSIELVKRPKERNKGTRRVSISYAEKNGVTINDIVHLKVFDEGDNLVAETSFSGQQFQDNLVERKKNDDYGRVVTYYTLEY